MQESLEFVFYQKFFYFTDNAELFSFTNIKFNIVMNFPYGFDCYNTDIYYNNICICITY